MGSHLNGFSYFKIRRGTIRHVEDGTGLVPSPTTTTRKSPVQQELLRPAMVATSDAWSPKRRRKMRWSAEQDSDRFGASGLKFKGRYRGSSSRKPAGRLLWACLFSALSMVAEGNAAFPSRRRWLDVRGGSTSAEETRERLYQAYNELHALARRYDKAFEAPAIVVVGAQSSGKSALIEALMGFQFNEVGGGTRTRRPIALRMHYNPECDEPRCYVRDERFEGGTPTEEYGERMASLAEVRAFVEAENRRLERDAHRSFENREIVVRVEYRHCPNLVLIDTPGLIASGSSLASSGDDADGVEQRKWRRAATEAYELALSRCKQREHILLCVEDTSDWKLDSIARRLCQQADPALSRTVVVNTKLDTKLVQFSQRRDVASFLRAKPLKKLHPHVMAGPFFTSVPSGRVRNAESPGFVDEQRQPSRQEPKKRKSSFFWNDDDDDDDDDEFDDLDDETFDTDGAFRAAVERASSADSSLVASRVGAEAFNDVSRKLGVAALRKFLEERVELTYRVNVARVLPLLRAERAKATVALRRARDELESLSPQRLRRTADAVADKFCRALASAVAGAVSAPPSDFGETLADERVHGGAFLAPDDLLEGEVVMPEVVQPTAEEELNAALAEDDEDEFADDEEFGGRGRRRRRMARGGFSTANARAAKARRQRKKTSMELTLSQADLDGSVGHAGASLYGGAQYRRAMREFAVAVRHLSLPELDEDEIANALGVGDVHDGADLVRAACVIAVDKARKSFEPQLETLAVRVAHVMRRLPPVLEYIINKQSDDERRLDDSPADFFTLVSRIYESYASELAETASRRCKDDLQAMTRFVTWDLAATGGDAASTLKTALSPMPALAAGRVQSDSEEGVDDPLVLDDYSSSSSRSSSAVDDEEAVVREWKRVATSESADDQPPLPEPSSAEIVEALTQDSAHEIYGAENSASSRKMVTTLVKRIASAWREHFARTVAVKFNCFFLVPFVDRFPLALRSGLDDVFDDQNCDLFDVTNARVALENRCDALQQELEANSKLHDTFDAIQRACTQQQTHASSSQADDDDDDDDNDDLHHR